MKTASLVGHEGIKSNTTYRIISRRVGENIRGQGIEDYASRAPLSFIIAAFSSLYIKESWGQGVK